MRSAKSISDAIFDIEGFAVIFMDADGNDASSKRVVEYPYRRAARGTWSLTQWKNERFAVAYPDFNVEVIGRLNLHRILFLVNSEGEVGV